MENIYLANEVAAKTTSELTAKPASASSAIDWVRLNSYESNWHIIDSVGLCDKKIAKDPVIRIRTVIVDQ